MDSFALPSFVLVIMFAFAVALGGICIVRLSQKKCMKNRELRRDLVQRIDNLPFPRVIQIMGLNFTKFFYSAPLNQIHNSVQLCEACASSQKCASTLAEPQTSAVEIDFCPVKQHIDQHQQ